jgi:hypothetical protein
VRAEELLRDTLTTVKDTADEDLDGKDDSDPDPMFDEYGYAVMTPEMDEAETYDALEEPDIDDPQANIYPREARETLDAMRPLSDEERALLEDTPFLDRHMQRVDDAESNKRLIKLMTLHHKAVDDALEDQIYGNLDDNTSGPEDDARLLEALRMWHHAEHSVSGDDELGDEFVNDEDEELDEEAMERFDTDSLGQTKRHKRRRKRTLLQKLRRGARRTFVDPAKKIGKGIGKGLSFAVRKVISLFTKKIRGRRARYLAWKRRGSKTPTAAEKTEARTWSKNWLRRRGGKFGPKVAAMTGILEGDFVDGDDEFAGEDFVGFLPVIDLVALFKMLLGKSSKEGAPKNPEDPTAEAPPGEGEPGEPGEPPGRPEISDEEPADAEPSPPDEEEASGDKFADYVLGRWR